MSDTAQRDRIEATARLGSVLEGRYRLISVLGEGGMGAVYEAQHTVIDRRVAIKMLHARYSGSEAATERFVREARSASAITHPNVIAIHDVGRADDGAAFIVMELLRGSSLAQLIRDGATLDPIRAIDLTLGVLAGLGAAHARGIVHRDLKPDNVFVVDACCESQAVRILDFGISKVTEGGALDPSTLTRTGAVLGTPFYMSPEQAAGERDIDARSDVWAVGVMLYEMLSGRLPFPGDSYNAVLARVLTRPPEALLALAPQVPAPLCEVVERALAKEREARFADVGEFAQALRRARFELTGDDGSVALGRTLDSLETLSAMPRTTPAPDARDERSASGERSASMDREAAFGASSERRPSAETLLGETLDAERGTDLAARPTPPPDATGAATPAEPVPGLDGSEAPGTRRPTLDVEGEVPGWKRLLWYALTLPLAWLPATIALSGDRALLRDMLALPIETPVWTGMLAMFALCGGLTFAALRVAQFWQHGRWSRWLHGEGFVVFPLVGLGMTLFHHLRLSAQHESHIGALRSYTAINPAQAEQLVGMLEGSNERFLAAATTDQLFIGVLALIVLLGYVFVRPRGDATGDWGPRRWAVLLAGVALIVGVETLGVFPVLSTPPLRVPLYVTWLLTAIALLRLRGARGKGLHQAWQTLRAGLIACVALTGLQIVAAVLLHFQRMEGVSLDAVPSYEREQLFLMEVKPELIQVTMREWLVLLVLLGMVVALTRTALRWHEGRKRDAARTVAWTVAIVAVTALPVWILLRAIDAVARQWLPLQIASMHPVALEPDGPLAFYIDRRPQTLYPGRKTLYNVLTGEPRATYGQTAFLEALAGWDDPAPCPALLEATLDEASPQPALCISGIEAQRYCEGRGMRLPTPAEWRAALATLDPGGGAAELQRGAHGEWTMHLVHDAETFVVAGRERDDEIPDLRADQTSPLVGFRCAFTFE